MRIKIFEKIPVKYLTSFIFGLLTGLLSSFFLKNMPIFINYISKIEYYIMDILHNPIWLKHSSYDLGVAVTATAIIVAFIEFISNKDELKFKLNYRVRKVALFFGIVSIILTFFGEFELFNKPFVFEISGAFSMFIAIMIYLYVIIKPLKKIKPEKIKIFQNILTGVLSNTYADKLKIVKGSIDLFENLLELSLKNKEVKNIFRSDFASDIFLKYFSESGYIFDRTIEFYIVKTKEAKNDLNHIEFFLKRLFIKSLENEESFLNMFLGEKIYPKSLFYLDKVLLKEKNNKIFDVLFGETRFNCLNDIGKLNYMELVNRYFRLIYQENNHVSHENGYKKNYDFNNNLIEIFFKEIRGFFESCFKQNELKIFLDKLHRISWYYRWCIRTEDKSPDIKIEAGKFLYNVFYSFINRYEIDNDDIFRIEIYDLYDHFIEMQENGSKSNIAYDTFISKIKEKIIDDKFGANYKGYYPAIILIYFHIFGFDIFSENHNETEDKKLHVPVLSKLSESFPRLYNGFKQEFYDTKTLPKDKEKKLKQQGRKILDDFLKDNMVYNFEENSLSYYYSGDIHSSKIFLNKVKKDKKIKVEKI